MEASNKEKTVVFHLTLNGIEERKKSLLQILSLSSRSAHSMELKYVWNPCYQFFFKLLQFAQYAERLKKKERYFFHFEIRFLQDFFTVRFRPRAVYR